MTQITQFEIYLKLSDLGHICVDTNIIYSLFRFIYVLIGYNVTLASHVTLPILRRGNYISLHFRPQSPGPKKFHQF